MLSNIEKEEFSEDEIRINTKPAGEFQLNVKIFGI